MATTTIIEKKTKNRMAAAYLETPVTKRMMAITLAFLLQTVNF